MFHLKIIKMIRYFLLFANINKINLYITSLKVNFYYLIHYISSKYFNKQISVLYTEKLVIDQVVIFNNNKII